MVWNEKLKREIPEGWKVESIFTALDIQYGFPFSTELFNDEGEGVPVVRIRDIIDNTISAYSTEKVDERYHLAKGDLLIGMDGNFHMNVWADNNAYLNQRSVRIRGLANSAVSVLQAKFSLSPYIKAKEQRAKGSTVGHLSDKDLKELYILVPSSTLLREILDNILSEIIANRENILSLTKQRDELLPLLMNGQVSVNYDLYLCRNRRVLHYRMIRMPFSQMAFQTKKSPMPPMSSLLPSLEEVTKLRRKPTKFRIKPINLPPKVTQHTQKVTQ